MNYKDKKIKATKIKGGKVYRYKICANTYYELTEVVDRRRLTGPYDSVESEQVGWKYVNKLYGFEYTDGELDYLSQY